MKRILMMVLRNIFRVPFMWIKLCRHAAHPERYTSVQHLKMMKYIVKRANIGGNVTIVATGRENIPREGGCIMYPNHQGLYDVLAIMDAFPFPFSVVAKKEVANIQFLKQIFACMRAYMLDREDIRQSMEVIINVSKDVAKGKTFIIFPEGTRSKDGNNVHEFKGGSFKAATKAKCPILPVALIDSYKPFDTKTLEPVTVQVHFLKPLYYDDYKDMKTTEIAEVVRKQIVECIESKLNG